MPMLKHPDIARANDEKPLQRRVLADHAYERLKELIVSRQIAPMSWMVIDVLARDLGVSQTPVREALARLESDDLVRKMNNGRYRTEPLLTQDSFNHLYDVRLQLEPYAAGLAARHINDEELADLRKVEASMEAAPTGGDYAQFSRFNQANAIFHDLIAKFSQNPFLYGAISRLHSHQRIAHLYVNHGIVDAGPAVKEHTEIVAAIAAHDVNSAADAMRTHIERSRRYLQKLIIDEDGQDA